jgi:DNA-binding HxlR family transcriptional regulator
VRQRRRRHDFLGRIGDKWTILIVVVLSQQPKHRARFSELKNGIQGISQTMLTSTLRALERDGLVTREVFAEIPPRVEYELTPFGLSVLEPMRALANWVSKNWGKAQQARKLYDQKSK